MKKKLCREFVLTPGIVHTCARYKDGGKAHKPPHRCSCGFRWIKSPLKKEGKTP